MPWFPYNSPNIFYLVIKWKKNGQQTYLMTGTISWMKKQNQQYTQDCESTNMSSLFRGPANTSHTGTTVPGNISLSLIAIGSCWAMEMPIYFNSLLLYWNSKNRSWKALKKKVEKSQNYTFYIYSLGKLKKCWINTSKSNAALNWSVTFSTQNLFFFFSWSSSVPGSFLVVACSWII